MEKYVQDIRLQQWAEIIDAANKSGQSRKQWLSENGISKDAFYYWQKKVRKHYAGQNGLVPAAGDGNHAGLVEVPVYRGAVGCQVIPAAIIRVGSMSVEINPSAPAEFMENLGRVIRNAL